MRNEFPTFNKQIEFYDSTYQIFQKAELNTGTPIERFFSIGGFVVRLRFAGPELVPLLTPALEHLAVPPQSDISLTISLWDSDSTNTTMPSPPWTIDDYSARGEVEDYNLNGFFIACHKGSGALSVYDLKTKNALWWIRRFTDVPFYEGGSPLLSIFHWWLQHNGKQVVHAGAVGTKEGGVLLIGKGGSGKSTASIACLNSELFYAGDDYSIISVSPAPYIYSLYNSGKLNADHIHNFPHLSENIHNKDRIDLEKPLLFFNKHYPDKLMSEFPAKAILLPRITGLPETTITPVSKAEGLKALAPSTLFQLSSANANSFSLIASFVKQVPCYHINLGTEINRIPDSILSFLSQTL